MQSPSNCLNFFYNTKGKPVHTPTGFQKLLLRGPSLRKNCTVCIGGSPVFGPNVKEPWPELLDRPTFNLGIGDASPATFLDTRLLELINYSKLAVVSVMTARNQVWECVLNEDGLKGCMTVDRVIYTDKWKQVYESGVVSKYATLARLEWVRDFTLLLERIKIPVILAWISQRDMDYTQNISLFSKMRHYPQLVNRSMVDLLRDQVLSTVSVITDFKGYYPNQRAHTVIAEGIRTEIERLKR